ncbi:MAG: peptide-methionine (S)-S-oxide reductase MsrA [Candidatus Caenarcaniphilales bacterium]|nr:peptide-methionine (S)-S-oxide reductase MsrA [Candidatus Caenarcaniphilales bacterium]
MSKKAIFAGGCFWCTESTFAKIQGVLEVYPGYIGDEAYNANYEAVSSGITKHYEAIEVIYDENQISYENLLDAFWREIDPTDPYGQFADKGPQYKSAIFYLDEEQKELAEKSKQDLEDSKKFDKAIATEIIQAKDFYIAEEYHCEYYKKNAMHYEMYRKGSGRSDFLAKTWGNNCKI